MAHDASSSTDADRFAADPHAQRVGAVYATAFVSAAARAGQLESLVEELDSLVDDVLAAHPALERVLASRIVNSEEKVQMLERMLAGRASPLLLNFLKVLARHERLDMVRAIRVGVQQQYDVLRGRIRVQVDSAVPLTEGMVQSLAGRLKGMLGGEPVLSQRVDPDLIGGVVLRVGDTVYDGSVSTQLKRIYAQMIDRSVHEIQSRRDRFSHPTGD